MHRTMFGDRDMTSAGAGSGTWEIVGSLRGWAAEDAAKAGLLESVNAALRERCEIRQRPALRDYPDRRLRR
jgi:hypothetical protein